MLNVVAFVPLELYLKSRRFFDSFLAAAEKINLFSHTEYWTISCRSFTSTDVPHTSHKPVTGPDESCFLHYLLLQDFLLFFILFVKPGIYLFSDWNVILPEVCFKTAQLPFKKKIYFNSREDVDMFVRRPIRALHVSWQIPLLKTGFSHYFHLGCKVLFIFVASAFIAFIWINKLGVSELEAFRLNLLYFFYKDSKKQIFEFYTLFKIFDSF